MALVLDATVGGTNSNSYLTLSRAGELAESLPHMADWFTNFDANKPQLLMHATRLIDRYGQYRGSKTSSSQALSFPRNGLITAYDGDTIPSNVIPDFIEWATIEWAFHLMINPDLNDLASEGLDSIRTPSFSLTFSGKAQEGPSLPKSVTDLLRPYAIHIGIRHARVLRT